MNNYSADTKFRINSKLNKIKMVINGENTKYPYNMNDDILFTQNEVVLYYKSNYLLSNNEKTERIGGNDNIVTLYGYQ